MAVGVGQRIQSLDRGLRILEYIADQDRPVRLGELAELLGVEKSSAHRLVSTLADRSYVKQASETLGYVLHEKFFALAGKPASGRQVQQRAHKYLRKLTQETWETAHLAVRGAGSAILVDHEFGSHPVGVTTQWGSSEPFHCTALGKALLAGMDKAQLREVLGPAPLKRYTDSTVTRIADLAKQCQEIEQRQVAFDLAEFSQDTNCVASPVYDFRGRVIAAIGISGPAERVSEAALRKAGKFVRQHAIELSAELGHQGNKSLTA